MTPLQAGTWKINANGYKGELVIELGGTSGDLTQITGTLYDQKIVGHYDARRLRLNFLRMISPKDPTSYQWFTGYLFWKHENTKKGHVMAGTFGSFGPGGTVNEMLEAGWVAERSAKKE